MDLKKKGVTGAINQWWLRVTAVTKTIEKSCVLFRGKKKFSQYF